jgi:hypothetical protein
LAYAAIQRLKTSGYRPRKPRSTPNRLRKLKQLVFSQRLFLRTWLSCKVVLDAESRLTRLLLAAGVPLTPSARSALMFRHKDCAVYQTVGVAGKASPGGVKVRMPLDASLSLAELAGKRGGPLYDYAVKIKGLSLPTAGLIYEGYMPYSLYAAAKGKAFVVMRKVLDAPSGLYYVEFSHSLAVPLKYYKYVREDRRAGGDSGMFYVPQDVTLFLREWGVFEPGAEAGCVYMRVRFAGDG